MPTMNVHGVSLSYDLGASYQQHPGDDSSAKQSRAEARAHAVGEFRKAARRACRGEIDKAVTQLIGLTIQLRALGGSSPELANKLREAADFLSDSDGTPLDVAHVAEMEQEQRWG
jgi:hypothetical protein